MSRVIKSAVWRDEPKLIERPEREADKINNMSQKDKEQVLSLRLAEITAKEERAKTIIGEAKAAGEAMLAEAEQKKEELLAAAQKEIEEQKEQARQSGHEEGFKAGEKEGAESIRQEQQGIIRSANKKAEHTLAVADKEMQNYVQQAEKMIMDMAMRIVEKILPQHFIDAPQVILPLVRKALSKIRDQNRIVIHVAPDNYEFVLMAKSEFQSMLEGTEPLAIKADDTLGNGDCVIESSNGTVDAKLATQLVLIKKSVQEVME
ncbi:MAG: FliH/SctL family protein [Selenomonadaceae bacterium]